jgi:hypothetical protein
MKPTLAIAPPNKPQLSRRLVLLEMEIQGWLNGQFTQQTDLEAARMLKDDRLEKSTAGDLQKSTEMIEALRKDYKKLGGQKPLNDIPSDVKVKLLLQKMEGYSDDAFLLQSRISAAHAVKNKELEENTTVLLTRTFGLVEHLRKQIRRAKEGSNGASK